MISDEIAAMQRLLAQRPTIQIKHISRCAIECSRMMISLLIQERKPLPLLDEMILRLVDQNVGSVSGITGFLGLQEADIDSALHAQSQRDLVELSGKNTVNLTYLGRQKARELSSCTPAQRDVPITFDRCSWEIVSEGHFLKPKEVQNENLYVVPGSKARVRVSDLRLSRIQQVLGGKIARDTEVDVLRIDEVVDQGRLEYLEALLAVFDNEDGILDCEVLIDLKQSPKHSLIARDNLDAHLYAPMPQLHDDAVVVQTSFNPAVLEPEVPRVTPEALPPIPPAEALDLLFADQLRSVTRPVRFPIQVFMHHPLLMHTLDVVQERLLIISPWLKDRVINSEFEFKLTSALDRGVQIFLVYGFGTTDEKSDRRAIRLLQRLADRPTGRLNFIRHANTHAKVLIADSLCVKTSFNWLSFEGSENRTYRQEEGDVTLDSEYAYREYRRLREEALNNGELL